MLWTLEQSQRNHLKWITKWKASYFTHPASYYPVPRTSMPLSAANFMISLSAESIPKEAEITMKEWAEHYRPMREREPFEARQRKTKQTLFHQLCTRRQKLEHGAASFLFQIVAPSFQQLQFSTGSPSARWEEIIYVNETYANMTPAFKRCCVTKMRFTMVCAGTLRVCFKYCT